MTDGQKQDGTRHWPLFFAEQLAIGDERNPVSIVTLWSRKDSVTERVDKASYSVVGNLYTADGVSYMIRNILANPYTRHIILFGADMMKTGDVLTCLMEKGIDEDNRIRSTNAFVHGAIGKDNVELFRRNVTVHDLRHCQDMAKLQELVVRLNAEESRTAFAEPKYIVEEEKPVEGLDTGDMAFRISGSCISETWVKALDTVLKFGEIKGTDYKIQSKEVLDLVSVIEGDEEALPSWLPVEEGGMMDKQTYIDKFFSAEKPANVDYTYGNRLFAMKPPSTEYLHGSRPFACSLPRGMINQIDVIEEKLRKDPLTRRAIAVTWNREKDIYSENPPCFIEAVWSVKEGRLHQTATFRSHDIYGGWLLNAYALRELQRRVSKNTEIPLGSMVILSISAHIYKNNWQEAEKIVEGHYANRSVNVVQDKRGYFLINVDADTGEIVVKHMRNDSRESKYVFKDKDPERLLKRLANENLISDPYHAMYVGKEVQRARCLFDQGRKFVQDAGDMSGVKKQD
ncbi:Putative thymidylate synthase [uncultured archaeon]|nr:Putative thymidylate synthase [uncultured archaeon]